MCKRWILVILLAVSLAMPAAASAQITGFSRLGPQEPNVKGQPSTAGVQSTGGSPPAAQAQEPSAKTQSKPADGQSTATVQPDTPGPPIPPVWPADAKFDQLSQLGRGIGIVYSPDFSVRGNRQFYEKLGFAYFEDPGWQNILNQITARNSSGPGPKIQTLIIETHGTNGEGLKLQAGPASTAARSYISIAALKEKLEGTGIHLVILAACNAGRLFRPEIYETLNAESTDPLFLPPSLGIINASPWFDPATSDVIVARRVESHLETTNEGETKELSPTAQTLLGLRPGVTRRGARPVTQSLSFAVSDMLIELLTHDPRLHLVATGYDTVKSRADYDDDASEEMYNGFLKYLNAVATRQFQAARPIQAAAAPRSTSGSRSTSARATRGFRASGR